jgi:hypothetical protein
MKQEKHSALKITNTFFGCIAITLLIAVAYLTFTQHQFAITINMWQAKMMGDNKYFPVLTMLLLVLPPLLLLLLIKLIVLQLLKK